MDKLETLNNYVPKYWLEKPSNEDEISKLPTILEIKEKLEEYENTHTINREDGRFEELEELKKQVQSNNIGCIKALMLQLGVKNKEELLDELQRIIDNSKFQHDNPDLFIVTKTNNCYTLKPNITQKHFLYRGQNEFYEPSLPYVYRGDSFLHLLENMKRAEFEILLESHPLFKLLKNGISLSNNTIFKIENPYGLAQHYGLKTIFFDFTSDFNVASFFATAKYDSVTDTYSKNSNNDSYGILYVYHMTEPLVTVSQTMTCIGLQAFDRPSKQKGFLLQPHSNKQNNNLNSNTNITKIFFKHDSKISDSIYINMDGGKQLFPNDILSEKTSLISIDNTFSEEAFERNLKDNPKDDRNANLYLLKQNDFSVSCSKKPISFSDKDLESYYNWIENGGWEKFCEQIIFPNDVNDTLKNELLSIKDKEEYKQYFYQI